MIAFTKSLEKFCVDGFRVDGFRVDGFRACGFGENPGFFEKIEVRPLSH